MPKGQNCLFVEPDCEHNGQEKKGCASLEAGEAPRGCPYAGSYAAMLPIADAAHLVHGATGCLESGAGDLFGRHEFRHLSRYSFSTQLDDKDMEKGGEKKLLRAIGYIAEVYHPSAIFVYATCITVLAIEDLELVCEQAEETWGLPVIPVRSPGFSGGGNNMGRRLAGEALADRVIGSGTAAMRDKIDYDINLIGEYGGPEEAEAIEALLSKAGIRILAKITGECGYEDVRHAHLAKVNMVVCSRSMITLARKMKDNYDIPYFEGSFYGGREIRFALRQMVFHLGNADLDKRIHRFLRKEEQLLQAELAPARRFFRGKAIVLYTDGAESWTYLTMLQELGFKIAAVGTNCNAQEDISRIKERVADGCAIYNDCEDAQILRVFRERKADLMLVSERNEFVPLKERIPFLSLTKEPRAAYAGYSGMRKFAKDLRETLEQPVWANCAKSAPWKE